MKKIDVKGAGDCLPNTVVLALFDYCYQTYFVNKTPLPADADARFKTFLALISPDKKKPLTFKQFIDDVVTKRVRSTELDAPYQIQRDYGPKIRELMGILRADPAYQAIRQEEIDELKEYYREGLLSYSQAGDPGSDIFVNNDYNKLFIKALEELGWQAVNEKERPKLEAKLDALVDKEFESQIYNALVEKDKKPGTWLGDAQLRFAAKYFGFHINVNYQAHGSKVVNPAVFLYGTTAEALKWPDKASDKLIDAEVTALLTILDRHSILDSTSKRKFAEASLSNIDKALGELNTLGNLKFKFAFDWLTQIRKQITEAHTVNCINLGSAHWNYLQSPAFAANWDLENLATVSPTSITPADDKTSKAFTANFGPKELADAKSFAEDNGLTMKRGTSGAPELLFYKQDPKTGKDELLFKDKRNVVETAGTGKNLEKEVEAAAKYVADRADKAIAAAVTANAPIPEGLKNVKITAANDEDLVKYHTIAEKYGLVVTHNILDKSLAPDPAKAATGGQPDLSKMLSGLGGGPGGR